MSRCLPWPVPVPVPAMPEEVVRAVPVPEAVVPVMSVLPDPAVRPVPAAPMAPAPAAPAAPIAVVPVPDVVVLAVPGRSPSFAVVFLARP